MLGVRPAPVLPTTRHYFSSQFRVFVHEIDFHTTTTPDLTRLPPGINYAVRSCANIDLLVEDIRGLLLRCISDKPEVPAGSVRGKLSKPLAAYQVAGAFNSVERDYLYDHGVNPIMHRNGGACLMGQKIITKEGSINNLVSYPSISFVHGVEASFLASIESPFRIILNDFDDNEVTRWCSENAKDDFLCTFETTFARRKTAYVFFRDERDASLFKMFFY